MMKEVKKKEAIMELKSFSGTTQLRLSANFWEALNRAIKALEQESCEDAVSRQAIEKLKRWRFSYDSNTTIPKSDLFVKLTDLRDLRSVAPVRKLKQESCEDAISRKAVLNTLDKMDSVLDEDRTVETYKELLVACYNDLPPVTPVHKTGKWIYSGSYDKDGMLLCSNCKHEIDVSEGYFKFCPNCGARMGDEE